MFDERRPFHGQASVAFRDDYLMTEFRTPLGAVVTGDDIAVRSPQGRLPPAGARDNQEGVRKINQKPIPRHHPPGLLEREKRKRRLLTIAEAGLRKEIGHVHTGVLRQSARENDRVGQLVVREGYAELDVFESTGANDGLELRSAKGDHRTVIVRVVDAVHGHQRMILDRTGEVLQPQLILDRHDEPAAGREALPAREQDLADGILASAEYAGILEHPDESHRIERLAGLKRLNPVADHRYIRQIAASPGGDPGPVATALYGDHLALQLAQEPGKSATAGAHFQSSPSQDLRERPQ